MKTTGFDGTLIEDTEENEACEAGDAALVAGTSWLFSREGMDSSLDYLFIDEAGQVSLADAVAMGTSARNIVLLGDPQQLPQVRQGIHPGESGRSVLEHLLAGRATVPEDRGVFLRHTWRMHPDVCSFISQLSYDGRLTSAEGRERQRITSSVLDGTGLRFLPVEHDGNAQASVEEANAVAAAVRGLLDGGTFTDVEGQVRPLTERDILVVAPYNMQVRCLREALPSRRRGRDRGQVPGSRSAGRLLLDGIIDRRGRAERPGVSLQPQPVQRRHLARQGACHPGVQSATSRRAVREGRTDAARQFVVPIRGACVA